MFVNKIVVIFKSASLNKLYLKSGADNLPSQQELEEMETFYVMLLKMENKRRKFSAKRLMKRIYPEYFRS